MKHEEITDKVIGCAYKVYNIMGFGFVESVYEKCLVIELQKASISAEAQKGILVRYEGHIVGEFKADILIEEAVIVELKSVKQIIKAHEVQLVNYLSATGKDIGLIINFAEKGVEIKRKVRDIRLYANKNPVNLVNPV